MRSSKSRSRSKSNRPRTLGNIINRVFDSSGPEGKVRGTPQQIIEKYVFLARDAQLSNDRVAAENFLQHAEHYTRMLAEANRELAAEQEARGPQSGNQNGQPSGQYGNQPSGQYDNQNGNQQNGNQQNGNQQNGNNRDRQGDRQNDNRDYRAEPRGDNRGEYRDQRQQPRADNRNEARTDNRSENRPDSRPDNRSENRNENRQDNRNENRPDTRSDSRSDYRPDPRRDDPSPSLMAGLNDLDDADTGLVATPEARQRPERAQPRVRTVVAPEAAPELPVAAPPQSADAAEAAPRKTRAPRKPRADKADAGGDDTGGDGKAAAE